MKLVNNFLYQISDDGKEVTIAKKAYLSNIAGQMLVNEQMEGILTRTGMLKDMVYEDCIYVGIVFYMTITEEELVAALSINK